MPEAVESIIIVRKKKGGHGGHHGGAWKVAYADFVTAMMSLFIVLWLTSSNDAVKKSVAAYFQDPKGTSALIGSGSMGSGHAAAIHRQDIAKLKEQLETAAQQLPHFNKMKKQIEISALPDGLEIELIEDPGGTFFERGSATPTPVLAEFLTMIAHEFRRIPNRISIEGHTDAVPYSTGGSYTNWELSTDRANAARRMMQGSGIGPNQIAQVRGFADQRLRFPDRPEDPSNRRITLIVEADGAPAGGVDAPAGPAGAPTGAAHDGEEQGKAPAPSAKASPVHAPETAAKTDAGDHR